MAKKALVRAAAQSRRAEEEALQRSR